MFYLSYKVVQYFIAVVILRNNKEVGKNFSARISVSSTPVWSSGVCNNGITHQTAYRYVTSLTANLMIGKFKLRTVRDWSHLQNKCLVDFSLLFNPLSLAAGHVLWQIVL
jgi:hypothetical protein